MEFDNSLATKTALESQNDSLFWKIYESLSEAIKKAAAWGSCIIHERAASIVLQDDYKLLRVHLYNTDMANRLPRAVADKTYDLATKTNHELVAFVEQEEHKRKVYRDIIEPDSWGVKKSYDLCLDSDMLPREKCAEILITTFKTVAIDLKHA